MCFDEAPPPYSIELVEHQRIEPICIFDISGSMDWNLDSKNRRGKRRIDYVRDLVPDLIREFGFLDTEIKNERHKAKKGGILAYAFNHQVIELDDINFTTWESKKGSLYPSGGTLLCPALELMMDKYEREFDPKHHRFKSTLKKAFHGKLEPKPKQLVIVLTDGVLGDQEEFKEKIISSEYEGVYFIFALIGVDEDPTFHREEYKKLQVFPNIKFIHFKPETTGEQLVAELLKIANINGSTAKHIKQNNAPFK